jgi:hypothetical protein
MTTIKLRRGTTAQWTGVNPVLAEGEPGYDTVADLLKIGDGTAKWTDLPVYPALENIGTGRIWTPRQFGPTGTGNDTVTFQKAVDALHDNGGGTLWCDEPQYKIGHLVMTSNVVLRSLNEKSTLSAPDGYSGWIIDTLPDKQMGIGIRDLQIWGGVTSATAKDTGGIQFQNTLQCQVSNVSISHTSLGCFKQGNGQATQIIGCGFLNQYQYRNLDVNEGALWLLGTDHIVIGCECNAGAARDGTSFGYTEVQYPDTLRRCGMLLAGSTIWVYGSNGEYGDVGVKINGTENRLIGGRGDVNAGPGIVVEGTYNSLTNTLVLANSLGADGTYSHIQLGPGAYGTVLNGVTEGINFTNIPNQVRYVVDDQVEVFGDPTRSDALPSIRDVVHDRQYKYRKVNQKNVSRAIASASAGNPVARPPSRYCPGQTFYDTKNNKLTVGDGSFWRDAGGVIVGNVIPPKLALLNDPDALGWTALSGGGTSGVAGVGGWAKFNKARALEITADGTANSCGAQTATPVANITRGNDPAHPQSYTLLAFHLGVTQLASLSFSVSWLDTNNNQVGPTVTTRSDAETAVGTAKKYAATGLVPPAAAVAVNLAAIFTRAGMAPGERYQITKFCLVPGGDPGNFVEP